MHIYIDLLIFSNVNYILIPNLDCTNITEERQWVKIIERVKNQGNRGN